MLHEIFSNIFNTVLAIALVGITFVSIGIIGLIFGGAVLWAF